MLQTVDTGPSYNEVPYSFNGGASYIDIFEQVRCAGLKIHYIPTNPNALGMTGGTSTYAYQFAPAYMQTDLSGNDVVVRGQGVTLNQILTDTKVKILNTQRPFKRYVKALKYKINSRYQPDPAAATNSHNYAGIWHQSDSSIGPNLSSASTCSGQHVTIWFPTPAGYEGQQFGQIFITGYFIFKDRKIGVA